MNGKSFTVTEVLAQLFDSESNIEEKVSEREDCVEEDPDFKEFSSDENESADPHALTHSLCVMCTLVQTKNLIVGQLFHVLII